MLKNYFKWIRVKRVMCKVFGHQWIVTNQESEIDETFKPPRITHRLRHGCLRCGCEADRVVTGYPAIRTRLERKALING